MVNQPLNYTLLMKSGKIPYEVVRAAQKNNMRTDDQTLREITDELYRTMKEGRPRTSLGQEALGDLNDIALKIMRDKKIAPVVSAAKSIADAAKAIHGLPVLINIGILPFGKQKNGNVTQT